MSRLARIALATAIAATGLGLSVSPAFAGNNCPTGGKAVINKSYNVGSSLHGNTHRGQTITVTFTVPKSCPSEQISLATYVAQSAPPFTKQQIFAQTLFDSHPGTFTPGTHPEAAHLP